jgi:hypothetical protein
MVGIVLDRSEKPVRAALQALESACFTARFVIEIRWRRVLTPCTFRLGRSSQRFTKRRTTMAVGSQRALKLIGDLGTKTPAPRGVGPGWPLARSARGTGHREVVQQ